MPIRRWAANTTELSLLPDPNTGGCGLWVIFGQIATVLNLYCSPSQEKGSVVFHAFRMRSIPSCVIGLVRSPGVSYVLCSLGVPRRNSTSMRPPLSASSIRSEEHTSELQSLMRISYDVFC